MKKSFIFLSLVLLVTVLSACSETKQKNVEEKEVISAKELPKEMPDDFHFYVSFGVNKQNEINTFDGTITKDLIADGTTTVDFAFTEEEMKAIYEKIKEVNITETKDFIPKPVKGTVCVQRPHADDEWKITLNGETFTHLIPGEYCEPTKDAKEMVGLRNYIFQLVKEKEVYQALPEANGGYE